MNFRAWLSAISCLLAALPALADVGPVFIVPLRTEVSRAQFFLLRRALKEAEREGASAFVIDMATYGGAVDAAIENMEALEKSSVPTFTYINDRAISAGALIALATQKIYMSPTAVVGASAPVMAGGEDLSKTMTDKTVSMLSAMARAAAQKNGHNADVAEAFIKKEKEVKIGDTVIDSADSLLTMSAEEATRLYDGKSLLAEGTAGTLEEMLAQAGLTGPVRRMNPTGFEQLALWVTGLAPLFLLGGIVGAYIEFKTPGFGLPGFASLVCFAIFFTGHYLAGLAGWEVAAVFGAGLLLVIGELFLHPGTVLPGVIGALMMVAGLIWAMIDRYPGESWWPTGDMLTVPLLNLCIAVALGVLAIYVLAKFLPRTSLYSRIVLGAASGAALESRVPGGNLRIPVGALGAARTTLRPSGKADFDGQSCDVVTRGEFLESGSRVRVVAVEGMRVVVAAEKLSGES